MAIISLIFVLFIWFLIMIFLIVNLIRLIKTKKSTAFLRKHNRLFKKLKYCVKNNIEIPSDLKVELKKVMSTIELQKLGLTIDF